MELSFSGAVQKVLSSVKMIIAAVNFVVFLSIGVSNSIKKVKIFISLNDSAFGVEKIIIKLEGFRKLSHSRGFSGPVTNNEYKDSIRLIIPIIRYPFTPWVLTNTDSYNSGLMQIIRTESCQL